LKTFSIVPKVFIVFSGEAYGTGLKTNARVIIKLKKILVITIFLTNMTDNGLKLIKNNKSNSLSHMERENTLLTYVCKKKYFQSLLRKGCLLPNFIV
jgi:hypothetical protein